jgi:protein SCO1
MFKKITAPLLLLLVVSLSGLIMIIPTFFTKNISRISLEQTITLPLILDNNKTIQLIFFGYAGCTDVCTPRLQAIADFYKTLDSDLQQKVEVVFLDISTPTNKNLPSEFAEAFHPLFKGIYLNANVLRTYTKSFNVYFSKSLLDKTEYNHTANLYMAIKNKNKKNLRYIYTAYPYKFSQIFSDLKELLHE